MKLSALQVKTAKPKDEDYKTFGGEGLFLLVKKNGNKHWRLKYKVEGKECIVSIGVYPEVSLKEARDERATLRKMRHDGLDPRQEQKKQKAMAVQNAANTFEAVVT